MSFGAVLGIWISQQVQKEVRKRKKERKAEKKWRNALMISLGVQAVLFPITLYHFFTYPLYSIFLNLFVIPLVSLLLILGAGGSLIYWIFPQGGSVLIWFCKGILDFYEISCRMIMRLPASELRSVGRCFVAFFSKERNWKERKNTLCFNSLYNTYISKVDIFLWIHSDHNVGCGSGRLYFYERKERYHYFDRWGE